MRQLKKIALLIAAVLTIGCCSAEAAGISKEEFTRLRQLEKTVLEQISEMEADLKPSKSLEQYKKEYLAAVAKASPRAISDAAMGKLLAGARYVLLGDEHTTDRSQQNAAMVLKLMKAGSDQVTLVIEWIDISFQNEVDAFLAGKLALKDLKTKISFDKLWGFSWTSYARILNAARQLKTPVLLVERLKGQQHSLNSRDDFIVSTINSHSQKNKGMRYLVVYGDYHIIGNGHLAQKLAKTGMKPQICLIGDAPEVYWKLLGSLKDPGKIGFAELGNGIFYIVNGTPLERSLSYRNYLMKMVGFKKSDFEEWVGPADIMPQSAERSKFEALHRD